MQFKLFPQTKDFPYTDSGLSGRVNDLFTRLDQMTSLVETHEAVSQRLTAQLETLNHEFRGVLQTVDDQVILPGKVWSNSTFILTSTKDQKFSEKTRMG